jgi:hypothetical protein
MRTSTTNCGIMLVALLAAAGCRTSHGILGDDHHADIPHGAIPAPLGTYACEWQQAQSSLADEDYFVLYPNEWRYGAGEDGTRLGPAGVRRLEEFARRLPHEPFSVVIDKSEDAGLDQARRVAAVEYLSSLGMRNADSRVVVGRGQANGLYGLEAPRIGGGFLQAGGTGGSGAGAGGFGGGGIGGGGLGGGGFGGGGIGGGLGGGGSGGGGFF